MIAGIEYIIVPFWIFRNNYSVRDSVVTEVVTPIVTRGVNIFMPIFINCEQAWNKPPLAIESLFHWMWPWACAELFYPAISEGSDTSKNLVRDFEII